jgi:hypothetical protein
MRSTGPSETSPNSLDWMRLLPANMMEFLMFGCGNEVDLDSRGD